MIWNLLYDLSSKRAFHEEAPHNNKTFSLIWFVEYEFFCAHWNETAAFVAAWCGERALGRAVEPRGKDEKLKNKNEKFMSPQKPTTIYIFDDTFNISCQRNLSFHSYFFCFVENFPAYHILIINNNSMWIMLVLLVLLLNLSVIWLDITHHCMVKAGPSVISSKRRKSDFLCHATARSFSLREYFSFSDSFPSRFSY